MMPHHIATEGEPVDEHATENRHPLIVLAENGKKAVAGVLLILMFVVLGIAVLEISTSAATESGKPCCSKSAVKASTAHKMATRGPEAHASMMGDSRRARPIPATTIPTPIIAQHKSFGMKPGPMRCVVPKA